MSISAVSNTTNPYIQGLQSGQMSDTFKQRKQDFAALGSALQSGDLAGAQKAFAALQQDTQSVRQSSRRQGADSDGDNDASKAGQTSQSGATKMKDLMNQLNQALNSGDLQGAQQAYAAIQQNMQARQGHHHHHGGQSATSGTAGTTSSTSTNGTSQTINVTA